MEFHEEEVGKNLEAVMQTMVSALKQYDQTVALAASEFFGSLVQVYFTETQYAE